MGLFFRKKKSAGDFEEEYYKDLHEEFYGERPRGKLSEADKFILDCLEDEEWDELDEE